MIKLMKEVLELFLKAIPTVFIPTLLVGGITWWIENVYGFNSLSFYCWIGFIWWMTINYIKK